MSAPSIRSQRLTHLLLAALALGVWSLLLESYLPAAFARTNAERSASFDTLTVKRINVVDPNGTIRFVIANSERFPGAKERGRTYPRSIHDTAGMLFFDAKGNEVGGLGLAKLRNQDVTNMAFDYAYQPTDGIGFFKLESPDGKRWQAGFDIYDRRPYEPGSITSSQGVQRVALEDENQNSQLVISDAQGHPRIRIGVDKAGEPSIEMLNPAGKVMYRAGERR
ncbi:MAG: hypothetical protein ACREHF_14635 [Rhizomicrobium sp.]